MAITKFALEYHEKMFPGYESVLATTDPELIEFFDNFAFDEVINEEGKGVPDKERFIAILSVLIGCQGVEEFRAMVPAAMNFDVTPIEIKEIVYQAIAYLGIGRVLPFLKAVNEIFIEKEIKLPLEEQGTTNSETRLKKGIQAQVDIFGKKMEDFYKSGSEETRHINRWLASNCFGDYYTRRGLDLRLRELITFCFLYAQGGCEPQLKGHVIGNINVGNDKQFLINIVSQCVPFIGYPRSLNALRCIEEVTETKEK